MIFIWVANKSHCIKLKSSLTSLITNFITFMLKSLVILVIRLAHTGTIYTQTAPLFSLNCIFSPANEEAVPKYNNQSDFKAFFEETNKIAGKWTTTSATFFKPPLYWINKIFVHRYKKPVYEQLNFGISKWI